MTRGRPLHIKWIESESELYQRYTEEKDLKRRSKLQMLWLIRKGNSIRKSCEVAGIKERCGQRYIKTYREEGLENLLSKQHGGERSGVVGYLNSEQENALKQMADEGKLKTVWEGIEWIKKQYDIEYSYEGMRSVFKRIKLSKKVPRKQHIKSKPDAQNAWKKGVWSPN